MDDECWLTLSEVIFASNDYVKYNFFLLVDKNKSSFQLMLELFLTTTMVKMQNLIM